MATRTITGTIYHPGGNTAWAGVAVKARLLQPFNVSTTAYAADEYTATTASDGTFSMALAVPATGTALYQFDVPGYASFRAHLGSGSSLDLTTLASLATSSVADTAALAAPSYVVLATSAALANERVLTAGSGIEITDGGAGSTVTIAATGGGGGGGAPTNATYLVTTASGDLSAEVVVGATPGGELGGTWASPTVDATHSGSSHAAVQAAAEATAASALATHAADTTAVHGIVDTSAIVLTNDARLSDARTPTSHASTHASAGSDPVTLAQSQVTNLTSDLALKAPLASPTLTGTPAAPTAAGGTNTTQIATTAFVTSAVSTHEADTTSVHGITDTSALVTLTGSQTLTNKTLTTPTIADYTNAQHDHLDADDGGTLSASAIASGTVATARLGSGTADNTTFLRGDQTWATPAGGISDGDKGDVTVSSSGTVWTIDNDAVTYAKLQNVSATSRILGRVTSGAGDVEELTGAQVLSITGAQTAIAKGRSVVSATTHFVLPGVAPIGQGTATPATDQVRYMPIVTDTSITVDQLVCEVTGAAAAGKTIRMAVYNADTDWQPTTLVVDAGTVAADSTGVKAASINTTLAAGRYLLAFNTDGAGGGAPTVRAIRGTLAQGFLIATLGANAILRAWSAAQVYGAYPGTGTASTGFSASTGGTDYVVMLRVSTP